MSVSIAAFFLPPENILTVARPDGSGVGEWVEKVTG